MIERTVYLPATSEPEPFSGVRAAFDLPADIASARAEAPPQDTATLTAEDAARRQAGAEAREKEADARIDVQDREDQQAARNRLREKWGDDYRTRINAMKGVAEGLPESIREKLFSARMKDGKALLNSPAALEAVHRLAEIGEYMRNDRDKYNRDKGAQEEQLGLIRALLKAGGIE